MALALYVAVAVATLLAWHRWMTPLSARAAVVLVLLPMPFVGPALVTDRAYGGYDVLFLSQPFADYAADYGMKGSAHNWYLLDHALQLAPWQHQVRQSFARHEWPLWNPAMNAGDILAAGMQPAPYNPLNLIALLLPLALATTFTAAMVFFLAGLFTLAFAREIGCSEEASLIAAAGFAFSSAVVFWSGWTHLGSWALLPLVLLAVRRASWPLLTFALAWLVLFGHPETALHVVAIGVVFSLFRAAPHRGIRLRDQLKAIAAGMSALLLTAFFWLPFVSVLRSTWQYDVYRIEAQHPRPIGAHEIARAAGATFIPYYGGATWLNPTAEWDFGMARVGSVIVALAAIALLRLWRRREVPFLAGLALVALLASWSAPPVTTLLRKLPLFAIAKNDRLGFAAAFALSMLAAIAFDARAAVARSRLIAAGAGAALMIATAALWRTRLGFGVQPKLMLVGAAAELAGVGLLVIALGARSPRVAVALVLVAIGAQRLAEDGGVYPTVPRRAFYPTVPLIARIPRDPLYRVIGTANLLVPNVAAMYGLEDVRGYAAMTYAGYQKTIPLWAPSSQRTYHDINDLTVPFLAFLGVRYALTPRTMAPPDGWHVVADDRNTRLMENERAIPRVFVPRTIRFVKDDESALPEMFVTSDYREKAFIRAPDAPPQVVPNGEAALQVHRDGAKYEIDVVARAATRVVIAEAGWPGWRAYVDGRRVKIAPANLAFLSVYVPAGTHRVRVVYLPDAFVRGGLISVTTLFLLGAGALVRSRAMRKTLIGSLLVLLALPLAAQQLRLPRPSPNSTLTQTVGLTDITIKYSRPGVKGRQIWGALVPYGQVWRTGANEATTITFSDDVKVDGQPLPKGTYAFFTVPEKDQWTLVFNKQGEQWGAFNYDQTKDALRFQVAPQKAEYREWMEFEIPEMNTDTAKIVLRWENVAVPFTVDTGSTDRAIAAAKKAISGLDNQRWQMPVNAADFALQNGHMEEARMWIDQALALNENIRTLWLKARLQQKEGKTAEAKKTLEAALAKAGPNDKDLAAEIKKQAALWP